MHLVSYMAPGFPRSLFETIGEIIGADVSFIETASGPLPGEDPFASGDADLGWICSTSFVDLALASPTPSVKLAGVAWLPDDPGSLGGPVYFGDLVVNQTGSATSLEDLRGLRIACNDPVSLSGHYSLRFALNDLGEDQDDFADLVFTGGHNASLDALTDGTVDAAIVDSVVRIAAERDEQRSVDLRVIDRLGPWPVQPLVARSTLDNVTVASVVNKLMDAANDSVLSRELNNASLSGLTRVGPDHYQGVRDAMIRLG